MKFFKSEQVNEMKGMKMENKAEFFGRKKMLGGNVGLGWGVRPTCHWRVKPPVARVALLCALMGLVWVGGCKEEPRKVHAEEVGKAAITNRVDIGPMVRQNLGVTFAKVESRAVTRTLRVPGKFELVPTARREYRTAAAGKVTLLVEQYQKVEAGTVLYRMDSPRWRELQEEMIEAQSTARQAQAAVDSIAPLIKVHEEHYAEVQKAVELWTKRVEQYEKLFNAGGARGEEVVQAKASLAAARTQLTEAHEGEVELEGKKAESAARHEAAKARQLVLLEAAASLTGKSAAELSAVKDGKPAWQGISLLETTAHAPGVVEKLEVVSGAWVEANAVVLVSVQPEMVRFRASVMQSDSAKIKDGMEAIVVAPQGGAGAKAQAITGVLTVAPMADAEKRTIEVVMTPGRLEPWARPGIAGYLEVVSGGSRKAELAVPMACVVRDGTQALIFRRDAANPDQAIRLNADLGLNDGRWVVIQSGVKEGDEIVEDGAYQLMVATSGSITKGGHFHADGTFHEGAH